MSDNTTPNSKFTKYSSAFDVIREKLAKQRSDQEAGKVSKTFDDAWKFRPTLQKGAPRATYKVRVLPNIFAKEASYPWVSGNVHMTKRPDGTFLYAICPSTFDTPEEKHPCPMCEEAAKLFKTKDLLDEKEARNWYKKKRFYANVQVLEDPRVGDENQLNQILVYEFGKQILGRWEDALIDQGMNFFDPLQGNTFNIIIKRQGEEINYNSSVFDTKSSPLAKTEEEMNKIFDSIHNIQEKVFGRGPTSYDKLLDKMNGKTESKTAAPAAHKEEKVDTTESISDVSDDDIKSKKSEAKKEVSKPVEKTAAKADDDDEFNFDS